MGRISLPSNFAKITDAQAFMRFVSQLAEQLADTINGNLIFDENFKTQTVSVTFSGANIEQPIAHKLNKQKVNYLVSNKSAACDIYNGSSVNTNGSVYLKSSVASVTVTLVLY